MRYQYCQCGEIMKTSKRTLNRVIGGREVTFKGVPAFTCDKCNTVLFHGKTLRRMDKLMEQNPDEKVFNYDESSELIAHDQRIKESLADAKLDKLFEPLDDEPITMLDLGNILNKTLKAAS